MKIETKKVIDTLQNRYNIAENRIAVMENNLTDADYIRVDDTLYHIYSGLSENEISETASYIYANSLNKVVENLEEEEEVAVEQPVAESLDDIKLGGIYKYEPQGIDEELLEDAVNLENETTLFNIAKFNPVCKVEDKLIVSKEEDDGFLLVSFDLPENEELMKNIDVRSQTFVVFESDLKPIGKSVVDTTEKVEVEETIDVTENPDAPYVVRDYVVDGDEIDLVCYDKEVGEEYYKYCGTLTDKDLCLKTMRLVAKDTTLSITPELYQEIMEFINNAPISGEERPVSEAIDNTMDEDENNLTAKVETSTSLLTALNSEKEAVVTYEMLLSLTTDEEEIELLTRILNDEKEHIALLSSLQTKQVADYVAEDNKEMLDDNAQDVIDAPAMTD